MPFISDDFALVDLVRAMSAGRTANEDSFVRHIDPLQSARL